MAKTSRELGLFVPPEKERQLHELEEVQVEQDTRVRRRMMFRWMGWGAVLVLLGQWSIGFISFFAPKRLGAFGGAVVAGLVTDFQVGDVKQVREGKFYITRVPEGFFALYWKCPHLGCTVPWAPQDPAMPGPPDGGRSGIYRQGPLQVPLPRLDLQPLRADYSGPRPAPDGPLSTRHRREWQDRRPDRPFGCHFAYGRRRGRCRSTTRLGVRPKSDTRPRCSGRTPFNGLA